MTQPRIVHQVAFAVSLYVWIGFFILIILLKNWITVAKIYRCIVSSISTILLYSYNYFTCRPFLVMPSALLNINLYINDLSSIIRTDRKTLCNLQFCGYMLLSVRSTKTNVLVKSQPVAEAVFYSIVYTGSLCHSNSVLFWLTFLGHKSCNSWLFCMFDSTCFVEMSNVFLISMLTKLLMILCKVH